eukprot:CAMPEP_0202386662 /NCGR_PEP_ID=MMETSP1127-20130417/67837_1 /ASSEMBLY_ACC=CAM_ASM_000462 /TAXON_ID=3047 /ORGANISM="Dunaliella tertiolecta, Strain CCMP1320" /LENGTH=141 /DNA_ID=CAMNT_0048987341 /DNA_START=357 /DNA_END=780 /DNA_ORIENTATION=+
MAVLQAVTPAVVPPRKAAWAAAALAAFSRSLRFRFLLAFLPSPKGAGAAAGAAPAAPTEWDAVDCVSPSAGSATSLGVVGKEAEVTLGRCVAAAVPVDVVAVAAAGAAAAAAHVAAVGAQGGLLWRAGGAALCPEGPPGQP